MTVNGCAIALVNGKYEVRAPWGEVITRIPRGVGAKRRAASYARAVVK